ncbi:MAG TPA: hypothetical protein VK488_07845 [Gaiellaceae bacterium]|nr:hypothetical protein [Gaiellaceae bacterium]
MATQLPLIEERANPPGFCQYVDGPCDQDFSTAVQADAFFIYPSKPESIAAAIEAAATQLRNINAGKVWRTWRELGPEGKIIFCEISKSIRFAGSVVADVTTLNFNLLFEIGYAIGLGVPVVPVRDTSYNKSRREFDALGVLDTVGYVDFANGRDLADQLAAALPGEPFPPATHKPFLASPLYVLRGPVSTEGTVKLLSTLKKSRLGFRTYDPVETPRLSLHEARRQVAGSAGVVAHLLSPHRDDAIVHNALCALICGIAMAQEKAVLMLQEEAVPQPIDYRDVVQSYSNPNEIPQLVEPLVLRVVEKLQLAAPPRIDLTESPLERLDLGDPAAENEIRALREYFVRTGAFRQAVQGHGRLVVGRKGTGKTAIFYEIRDSLGRSRSMLVLDLKPEGHQFTKLREAVLSELPTGLQEHTVTAFWNYILLAEMAHKILERERHHAYQDGDRLKRFEELEAAYLEHALAHEEDLSQRLLRQVDRLVARYGDVGRDEMRDRMTEVLYATDIRTLDNAVSDYLQEKESVWLLIDNLDKSWATRGTTPEDIQIVRGLLEATRKLQRQLEERGVEFKCLVFIRTDVHEHLVRETPDKDKDTAIRLDWDDPELLQEIIRKRIATSTDAEGAFSDVWRAFFVSHVGVEESFNYMVERTLMRPRDLLKFVQRSVEVALNRGHSKVTAEDILQAEQSFSEDMLLTTQFEIEDTTRALADALFVFVDTTRTLTWTDAETLLRSQEIAAADIPRAIELLVWFGFLGVAGATPEEDRFAYQVRYNVPQLLRPAQVGDARLVIHPAFHAALRLDAARDQ